MSRISRATRIPRSPRRNTAFRRGRLVASAVALGILISGCGSSDSAPPSPAGTPRKGGSLTLTLPGEAASFDPAQTSFVNVADGSRMSAVYDSLVWTDPTTGAVQPKIAESLAPEDPQASKWLLRIRPNVKFSDDTPYDAAAVKANWDRHADMAVASFQAPAAFGIAKTEVDAANPLVLHITLKAPNANFDRSVARNLSFNVSPTAMKADPGAIRLKPVGAGPFILKEWIPNERQVFVRNPNYWQKDKGLPYLDQLIIRVDIDVKRGVESLGKESDISMTVDPKNIALARSKGLGVEELKLNGGAMILFNTQSGPFSDVKARRAVALALNSAEINDKFYDGTGTPAKGIFSSSSPLANIQLTAPENDPAEAAKLFDEVTKNGTKPLEFTYIAPSAPTTVDVARFIQQKLSAYRGVTMKIQQVDIPTYIRTVRARSSAWSAAVGQQWIDDPEPGIYDMLHSTSFANSSALADPEIDAALEDARRSTDTERRRDAYTRLQVQLNKQLPFWVYQEATAAAVYTGKVTGLQLFNDGLILWDRIGLHR
ncbi:ABC transporter substrate-binding protein [Yinghuangia seranimata]|uniref:ABC transporter substrate-binding protein n=1 Tax=Yinghuangia seranimata TaxID=408067 RepID=UPI00248C0D02|nr:ABC transporter substrate-binding protein [Yinghuangia seranimata]MDI2129286.1 ABC transporter substrate-binding protein [Yinghuangia seranimata]